MGALTAGSVVAVPFPFSDLSHSKLRPAVVLAEVEYQDWILCQITSKPYADPKAVSITEESFARGALQKTSYARPGKLFTTNQQLIVVEIGLLTKDALGKVIDAVVEILRDGLDKYQNSF